MKSGGSGGRSKKGKAKCADFEGLWKGINPEDYSNILASITCDEDTATVVGNDSKAPVCGGEAGGITKVYELVEGILIAIGLFDVTCEDGTEVNAGSGEIEKSTYELLPNGSLSFDDGFAVLWKQNSD